MPAAARKIDKYVADESFLDAFEEDADVTPARSSAIQSGWEAALNSSANRESGGYVNDFRFSTEPQLVKFLASEPIAVYQQHWIERNGKKSWTCLGDENKCPLCRITGDRPRKKVAFSIVNLSAEEPTPEILTISPKTTSMLARYNDDKATGPLDRLYYSLSKTGTGPQTVFHIQAVKPRDLAEDWGIDPDETESVLATLEPLDSSVISYATEQQLQEIASEFAGGRSSH